MHQIGAKDHISSAFIGEPHLNYVIIICIIKTYILNMKTEVNVGCKFDKFIFKTGMIIMKIEK